LVNVSQHFIIIIEIFVTRLLQLKPNTSATYTKVKYIKSDSD